LSYARAKALGVALTLASVLEGALASCSRYGVPISEDPPASPIVLHVPENFETTRRRVYQYLKSRDRVESVFTPTDVPGEIRLNQPWVRDTSLRYMELEYDARQRHIVEWKGQWILKSVSESITEVRLNILELLFLGPAREASPRPTPNADWFETGADGLRAALELRRFWAETYPALPLPKALANVQVPALDGPPVSRTLFNAFWPPLRRRRAF
jgi:hypothetical protein